MTQIKNAIQDEQIKNIHDSIKTLNDHSGVLTNDIADIKIDVKEIKTDVSWLKRFFWVTVTAAIGAVVTGIINLYR